MSGEAQSKFVPESQLVCHEKFGIKKSMVNQLLTAAPHTIKDLTGGADSDYWFRAKVRVHFLLPAGLKRLLFHTSR